MAKKIDTPSSPENADGNEDSNEIREDAKDDLKTCCYGLTNPKSWKRSGARI